MRVLTIIPAFNEGESLEAVINTYKQKQPDTDYVIINDGSSDNTAELCKKHNFNCINLPVNLGLAGAFQTGMQYALENGYDAAVQFDGDGQHDAAYISEMAEKIQSGTDIVIGSRFVNEKKPKSLRMLGNNLIEAAIFITTGKIIKDTTSGMRMYNKKYIEILAKNSDLPPEPDTVALFIRGGAKVEEIGVKMYERTAGESYLNLKRAVTYMLRMFVSILLLQWFRKARW